MKRSNTHRKLGKKSKKGLFFVSFIFLLVVGFLLRQPLLKCGVDVALNALFPKSAFEEVSYESLQWDNGRIVLSGMKAVGKVRRITVDRLEVGCSFSLFPLHFQPNLVLVHPEVTLEQSPSSATRASTKALTALLPTKYCSVKMDVHSGVINLRNGFENQRFYFVYQSGNTEEKIGSFSLAYDPNQFTLPLLFVDMQMEEQKLATEVKLQQVDVARLLKVASFFYPEFQEGWNNVEGELELSCKALFDLPLSFTQVSGFLDVHNLNGSNTQLGIQTEIEDFHGEFTYPFYSDDEGPIWKRVMAQASLKGCDFVSTKKAWGIKGVDAHLLLDPNLDPAFNVQGSLIRGGVESDLTMEGKGSVHEDRTFWLELAVQLEKGKEAFLSLCSLEKEKYVVQANLVGVSCAEFSLLNKLFSFSSPLAEHLEIDQGTVEGKITAWLEAGNLSCLQFENLLVKNLHFVDPETKIGASIETIHLDSRFENQKITHLSALLSKGSLHHQKWDCKDLAVEVQIENDQFLPSTMHGMIAGVELHAQAEGAILAPDIDIVFCSTANRLFPLLFPGAVFSHQAVTVTSSIKKEDNEYNVLSRLEFENDPQGIEQVTFGCSLNKLLSMEIEEGWVRCEKISSEIYQPLIAFLAPQCKMDGAWDLFGTFNRKEIALSLQGSQVTFDHPMGVLHLDSIGAHDPMLLKTEGRIALKYDLVAKKWAADIPLSDARFLDKKWGLALDHVKGLLKFDGTRITGEKLSVDCAVNDKVYLEHFGFDLFADTAEKRLALFNLRGNLILGKEERVQVGAQNLDYQNGRASFNLYAQSGAKELMRIAGTAVEDVQGNVQFSFERGKTHLFNTDLSGSRLVLNHWTELSFVESYCQLDLANLHTLVGDFAKRGLATVPNGLVKGIQTLKPEGVLHTKVGYQMGREGLVFHLGGENLKVGNKPIKRFVIKGDKKGASWTVTQMQVDQIIASAVFVPNESRIDFLKFEVASGDGLRAKGNGKLLYDKQRFLANLESLRVDLGVISSAQNLKGCLTAQGEAFVDLPQEERTWSGAALLNTAMEFTHPVALQVKNKERLKCQFSADSGIKFQGIDLAIQGKASPALVGQSLFAALEYELATSKWKAKGCQFSFAPAWIDALSKAQVFPESVVQVVRSNETIKGSLDFEGNSKNFSLEGSLSDGVYKIVDRDWKLSQLAFKGSAKDFLFRGKSTCEEVPLLFLLQLDFSQELLGMLKVQENPNAAGVKVLFRKNGTKELSLESIQGLYSGLDVQLTREKSSARGDLTAFEGTVKCDMSQAARLLSKELQGKVKEFRVGKGYELSGRFALGKKGLNTFHFFGELRGKDFGLMGLEFQELHAQAEVRPEQMILRNVSIADEAGAIAIRQIKLQKQDQKWSFDIPYVKISELSPSTLQKRLAPDKSLKPFVIKNLYLEGLRGVLGDLATYTGQGQLNFANSVKKESNFLDLPMNIIKDLGLDFGLLTPIYGELVLQIKGDKCYFTEMTNAFSEGRRSQFFLTEQSGPAYLDLSGNLHMDLKMKQDHLLKIVEPFILTVRGTLEKPRYGLQKIKDEN
jgi:hypothetical protein